MGRRYYGHRRSYRRSYGSQRARQHVSEAAELSQAVGGTDEDVKKYFYSLNPAQLRPILNDYGRLYGQSARTYAAQTIPLWQSQERQMSGMVAKRLFELLPKHMPIRTKYALVETIWKKFAPRSEHSVAFGPTANPAEVSAVVHQHLTFSVNGHIIPEPLQRRFDWLAAGDTQCMQEMLNHFLTLDRDDAKRVLKEQVSVISSEIKTGNLVQGFKRSVTVGGHTLHVFFDPRAKQVKLSQGPPRFCPPTDYSWVVAVVVILVVLAVLRSCLFPH